MNSGNSAFSVQSTDPILPQNYISVKTKGRENSFLLCSLLYVGLRLRPEHVLQMQITINIREMKHDKHDENQPLFS
jgi:hypothetical protein